MQIVGIFLLLCKNMCIYGALAIDWTQGLVRAKRVLYHRAALKLLDS